MLESQMQRIASGGEYTSTEEKKTPSGLESPNTSVNEALPESAADSAEVEPDKPES